MNSAKAEELKAKRSEREHDIREQWIRAMEFRIVSEQLQKCQRTEGVNHYENCKEWSERYLNMLESSKVTGYLKVDV